jgi:hypothetical protein
MNIEKRGVGNMVYEQLRLKSLRIGFPNGEKCLFFKVDSYLSNYLSKKSVFSQNPKTTTTQFIEKTSNFIFGEWFNE